jgi:hypothetical protein
MTMQRDTEFRWEPTSRSSSKLAMSLLVGLAGLATGYMFVHVGYQQAMDDSSLASTLEIARTSNPPLANPANDEPSAVATAAPPPVQLLNPHSVSRLAEPASDEPSAVATVQPPIRLPNPPAQVSIEREQLAPPRSVTKSRPSSDYATLRQALLRKMR